MAEHRYWSVDCATGDHADCPWRLTGCGCSCHDEAKAEAGAQPPNPQSVAAQPEGADYYEAQCTGCYRKFPNESGTNTYCHRCNQDAWNRSQLREAETLDRAEAAEQRIESLENAAAEVNFERDQANAALEDAYRFIRLHHLWDDFMATMFVQDGAEAKAEAKSSPEGGCGAGRGGKGEQ